MYMHITLKNVIQHDDCMFYKFAAWESDIIEYNLSIPLLRELNGGDCSVIRMPRLLLWLIEYNRPFAGPGHVTYPLLNLRPGTL